MKNGQRVPLADILGELILVEARPGLVNFVPVLFGSWFAVFGQLSPVTVEKHLPE
ncbi:MAG TPA: hypothetical protein VHM25_13510 [Polyangiaceae bacterium]|jgi:hypothetical protein|nr:hypothetical protein [Polyangiaceae bacterium]